MEAAFRIPQASREGRAFGQGNGLLYWTGVLSAPNIPEIPLNPGTPMRKFLVLVPLCVGLLASSCVLIFQNGEVREVHPGDPGPTVVNVPMKVFLQNGDVVLYREGASMDTELITGRGVRYTLNRQSVVPITELPLDSIIGIEAFQASVNAGATFVASVLASAGVIVGGAALSVAIFGSCPTFYASPAEGGALQAETFSYSIASQLETRDLDGLNVSPDPDGIIRLELRNEALETHYINQVELVAFDHEPGVHVVPNEEGIPIAAADPMLPLSATDRSGRSVLELVQATDDLAFSSSEERIRAATSQDSRDYLELTFPRPVSDEAVLLLGLRNSLLNTVLYYDLLLGTVGAQAVNWWGGSSDGVGKAWEMARWYVEILGLTVEVREGNEWRRVTRLPDTGPIAWKEVGLKVPVPDEGPVQLRLSFLADDWRIDQVSLATSAEVSGPTVLPIHRVVDRMGDEDEGARALLASADEDYLLTYPGHTATLEFLPPGTRTDRTTTYLLAAQGYYIEWIRPEWVRSAQRMAPFEPGPGSVERLLATWLQKKDTFEDAFFNSKIPVR